MSQPPVTTLTAAAIRARLCAPRPARLSIRAAHPRPEEPAAIQLRQALDLPDTRTADCRPHQCRTDPCPLAGNPAGRRLDPDRHGDGIADHAPAGVLPAAERRRGGATRIGPAGAHLVYARLDRGPAVAPGYRPRAQQGRVTQQLGAGRLPSSARRNPRPYLRKQQHRAAGLNLLVTAIILWNTRY